MAAALVAYSGLGVWIPGMWRGVMHNYGSHVRRALIALLSLQLALGLVPAPAWASVDAAQEQTPSQEVATTAIEQLAGPAAADQDEAVFADALNELLETDEPAFPKAAEQSDDAAESDSADPDAISTGEVTSDVAATETDQVEDAETIEQQPDAAEAAGDADSEITDAAGATQDLDLESEWAGYKGTDQSGIVDADTPTSSVEVAWSASLWRAGDLLTNVSDPIIVNGDVYIVADNTIHRFDAKTGEAKGQAPLAGRVGKTCHIRYADGLVLVPLGGGRVQALAPDTLATAWLSDSLPESHSWMGLVAPQQCSSTILTYGGRAYMGTTDGWGHGGSLQCLDVATGASRWVFESASGYQWAGCAMTDAGLVVCDDGGMLALMDPVTGAVKASLQLSSGSHASVVAGDDGSTVYVVTTDGVLRKVGIGAEGFVELASAKFAASSSATPTIVGDQMVVAGATDDHMGVLGVVDLRTFEMVHEVTLLDTVWHRAIPGDIKSAPLVGRTVNGVYVYFTANSLPGSLYIYRLGDVMASELFAPAFGQMGRCEASPIAAHDGTLYYTNDSATLFALRSAFGGPGGNGSHGDVGEHGGIDVPVDPGIQDSGKEPAGQTVEPGIGGGVDIRLAADAREMAGNTGEATNAEQEDSIAQPLETPASAEADDADDTDAPLGTHNGGPATGALAASRKTTPVWPFVGIAGCSLAVMWVTLVNHTVPDEFGDEEYDF